MFAFFRWAPATVALAILPVATIAACSDDSQTHETIVEPTPTATPTVLIRPPRPTYTPTFTPSPTFVPTPTSEPRIDINTHTGTDHDSDAYPDSFTNPDACRYRNPFANYYTHTDAHLGSNRNAYTYTNPLHQLRHPPQRPPRFPPQRLPIHQPLHQLQQKLLRQLQPLHSHLNRQPPLALHLHQFRHPQAMSTVQPISW